MTPPSKPVRVLVVDDDAMSRELLSILLQGEGYRTQTADSGDAALALVRDRRAIPQVILTDMQMPGISGPQLADGLRRACGQEALLLAMSGSNPKGDAIERFDAFLMKPFSMRDFALALAAASMARAASVRVLASKHSMESQVQEMHPGYAEDEAEMAQAPALDEGIYKQLSEAMPPQQLRQMYAMCVNDARDRVAAMRGLVSRHDAEQFIRQAHAIKGGCGMLGASEIYGMAAQLEDAGLDAAGLEGSPGVNPLDELITACDRLERILGSRA